jgi:RNA polymerase sigma factor (sigma-70 family)
MPLLPADAELLVGARTDPDQFAELYRRTVDSVMGYVVRRCTNPADVADLVASTYLVALESLDSFDPVKGKPLPWLFGIAGRLLANQRRRSGRAAAATARLHGRRLLDSGDVDRLVERIDAERLAPRLQSAIESLPDHHREAVLLTTADGLTIADAALALGLHPAAFRVRLHRARKALHRQMEAEGAASTAPVHVRNGDVVA